MRLISLTFMVCASTLAADPLRTSAPIAMSDVHAGPKIAKSKPTFHPLKLDGWSMGKATLRYDCRPGGFSGELTPATRKLCHVQVL